MKYTTNNWGRYVQLMFIGVGIAQWWHSVASSEVMDLLYPAMWVVSYRCITMASKMASKVKVLFDCHFVDCCPGSHRDDTEGVVVA